MSKRYGKTPRNVEPFDVNYDEVSSAQFTEFLTNYLNDTVVQDPEVGSKHLINTLTYDGRYLYAIIGNHQMININVQKEKEWLKSVILKSHIDNNKQIFQTILENQEEITQTFQENQYYIEILENSNKRLEGAISTCFMEDVRTQFYKDIQEQKNVYECKVLERNKGGYMCEIHGISVFLPGSLASHRAITDYDSLLGKTIPVMIETFMRDMNIFVVSHKRYINSIYPTIIENLDKTQQYTGYITGTTGFGIFVEFGEYFNGLLHLSEMSETTLAKFERAEFSKGDEIKFYIKTLTPQKIILTETEYEVHKQRFEDLKNRIYKEVIKAKVHSHVSTGWLFDISDGVRGLLYDVEAVKFNTKLEIGKEYYVYVDTMDFNTGKIYLKYNNQ